MTPRRRTILVIAVIGSIVCILAPIPVYVLWCVPARDAYFKKKAEPNPASDAYREAAQRETDLMMERIRASADGRFDDYQRLVPLEAEAKKKAQEAYGPKREAHQRLEDNEGHAYEIAAKALWLLLVVCGLGLLILPTVAITALYRGGLVWGPLSGLTVGLLVGVAFVNVWFELTVHWKVTTTHWIVFTFISGGLGGLVGLVCGFFTRKRRPAG